MTVRTEVHGSNPDLFQKTFLFCFEFRKIKCLLKLQLVYVFQSEFEFRSLTSVQNLHQLLFNFVKLFISFFYGRLILLNYLSAIKTNDLNAEQEG